MTPQGTPDNLNNQPQGNGSSGPADSGVFVGRSYYGSAPAVSSSAKSFEQRVAESRARKAAAQQGSQPPVRDVPMTSENSGVLYPPGSAISSPELSGAMPPISRAMPPVSGAMPPISGSMPPVSGSMSPVSESLPPIAESMPPASDPQEFDNAFSDEDAAYSREAIARATATRPPLNLPRPASTGSHWPAGKAPMVAPYESAVIKPKKNRLPVVFACVLALAVAGAAGLFAWNNQMVDVTVNGQNVSVRKNISMGELVENGYATPSAGDFLAVDGSVIEEGGGEPYAVTVNGELVSSDSVPYLDENAVITVEDGADITEDYTESEIEVEPNVVEEGTGAIHIYRDGENGTAKRKTGTVSGKTVDDVISEPQDATLVKYNADTGGDKVLCLTFDDGPWASPNTTEQILDLLAQYDAKATFFTVGERIEACIDQVKRAHDEGHQICTHTWDHASSNGGQGVNLTYMTAEDQVAEVVKGYQAIENATGEEASTVIRTPGGNFYGELLKNLKPHITAEIGWNIDTNDWKREGVESIANAIMQAQPGNIILMHDGGGDRTMTVEALRETLPKLVEQGYRFITIDELLEYGVPE